MKILNLKCVEIKPVHLIIKKWNNINLNKNENIKKNYELIISRIKSSEFESAVPV